VREMLSRCLSTGVGRGLTAARSRSGLVVRKLCTEAKAPPPPPPPPPEPGMFTRIQQQIVSEIGGAKDNSAKYYGFFGACCNWFLGISGMYEAIYKPPEAVPLPLTCVLIGYSTLFGRWAGWAVTPRNYVLAGSHIFNVIVQSNQLRRCLTYKLEHGGEKGRAEVTELATNAAIGGAVIAGFVLTRNPLKAMVAPYGPAYLSSPGGPFTIHPWPPVTKLMLSITAMTDIWKDTDKIQLPTYSALALTGAIFSMYGLVVTPINYPLTSVNILLCASYSWHSARKVKADYM